MVNKNSDKTDLIYDFVKNIDTKVDQIAIEQARQGEHIDRNTDDLKEHIEGVKQVRVLIANHEKLNEVQFQKVLYPKQFTMSLIKIISIVGGISASIYAVYRLILLVS